MIDRQLIKSVLGFNFKTIVTDHKNQVIKFGIARTISPLVSERPVYKNRIIDKKFWTNYNENLLNKILDYRRNNIDYS